MFFFLAKDDQCNSLEGYLVEQSLTFFVDYHLVFLIVESSIYIKPIKILIFLRARKKKNIDIIKLHMQNKKKSSLHEIKNERPKLKIIAFEIFVIYNVSSKPKLKITDIKDLL